MRSSRVLVMVASIVALHAQQDPPTASRDPFVGTWRANVAKSTPRLNKTEASYERVIARQGDELLFSSSGGSSKAKVRDFRLKCDGRFYPLPTGPVLRCAYLSANRVNGETRDPDGRLLYWTREVSDDGQQMIISEFKDDRRTKLRSRLVLDRVN